MVFNENFSWTDPITETTVNGGFIFETIAGMPVGIKTVSIATEGEDLYLINSGNGVISVTGTNNYEGNVTDDDLYLIKNMLTMKL